MMGLASSVLSLKVPDGLRGDEAIVALVDQFGMDPEDRTPPRTSDEVLLVKLRAAIQYRLRKRLATASSSSMTSESESSGGATSTVARAARQSLEKDKADLLDPRSIVQARDMICKCPVPCRVPYEDIEVLRRRALAMHRCNVADWAIDTIYHSYPECKGEVVDGAKVLLGSTRVCAAYWRHCATVKDSMWRDIRLAIKQGQDFVAKSIDTRGMNMNETSKGAVSAWFRQYAEDQAEVSPLTGKLQLQAVPWETVYLEYVNSNPGDNDLRKFTQFGYFCSICREECKREPVIEFKHSRLDVGKCIVCQEISEQLARRDLSPAAREQLKEDRRHHREHFTEQRAYYQGLKEKAKNKDNNLLVISMDAMDQAKTSCPHFARLPANLVDVSQNFITMKLSCQKVGDHFADYIVTPPWVKTGADLVVECLHLALQKAQADGLVDNTGMRLHLQVDGASDNWNKVVFAYCVLLVHIGMFRRVTIGRMPVGHTHFDVDQLHSLVSCAFSGRGRQSSGGDAVNLTAFLSLIESAFTNTNVRVKYIARTSAWTEWLTPFVDAHFGGYGPRMLPFVDEHETVILRDRRKATLVHFLDINKHDGHELPLLRCVTLPCGCVDSHLTRVH